MKHRNRFSYLVGSVTLMSALISTPSLGGGGFSGGSGVVSIYSADPAFLLSAELPRKFTRKAHALRLDYGHKGYEVEVERIPWNPACEASVAYKVVCDSVGSTHGSQKIVAFSEDRAYRLTVESSVLPAPIIDELLELYSLGLRVDQDH